MEKLQNIKKIVSNYSPEYDESEWLKLEKKLDAKKSFFSKKSTIISSSIVAVAVISITAVLLINKFSHDNNLLLSENITENNSNSKPQNQNDENINTTINLENSDNSDESQNINNNTFVSDNNNISTTINTENKSQKNTAIVSENSTNSDIIDLSYNRASLKIETTSENQNNELQKTEKNNDELDVFDIVFDIQEETNCVPAKVRFVAKNLPQDCSLIWNLGNNEKIKGNDVDYTYKIAGEYKPSVLVVQNNFVLRKENLPTIQLYSPTQIVVDVTSENLDYYFRVRANDIDKIEWSLDNEVFSDKELYYSFNHEDNYSLSVKMINTNGCQSTLNKTISVKKEPVFYLPTAFTPNSGDLNSKFGPIGDNLSFVQYFFKIVDKAGKMVFVSQDIDNKWDGKIMNSSVDAPADVYIWELKIVDSYNRVTNKKGKVNLFR